jgi:hypothetical protein
VFLGYAALAAALFGLAAVLAEILVKNPDALREITRDAEGFARPQTTTAAAALTAAPANDSTPRIAA